MRPGLKVVCLRDGWNNFPEGIDPAQCRLPQAGCEYVVRSIRDDPATGGIAIRLHWLFLPHNDYGEPAFGVVGLDGVPNFKPVIETDISIFTKMLAPTSRQKELV